MARSTANRRLFRNPRGNLALRPAVAEINLAAIAFNLRGIRSRVGREVKIMAVVKANAYGHGLENVAAFVEKDLADYLGVAIVEEGVALRKAGIRKPIQVLSLTPPPQVRLLGEYKLEPTVCSLSDIEAVDALGRNLKRAIPVHIKIDTGMNRIGVKREGLEDVLRSLGKAKRIAVRGVFTHFATADQGGKGFVRVQLDEFVRTLDTLRGHKLQPEYIHCANSGAILDVPESYFSMVRPGIIMYGYYPTRETTESVPLRPAMTLKTRVAFVKWISPGESVSYGRRFIATKRTQIATLPIGYADGYSRMLTGKASALILGEEVPVVGTICMDQMMADVGDLPVHPGDEAILLGQQDSRTLGAWDIADKLGTIPYEICSGISTRIPRVYITP